MKIRLTGHLKARLKLRKISIKAVKDIYFNADNRYYDTETEHFIAIKKVFYEGKQKNLMVAYMEINNEAVLLTIHPLKFGQRKNRIERGRWRQL